MDVLGLKAESIAFHAVNFLLLLFILKRYLYKPVITMLDERARKIRESAETAERVQREAASAEQQRAEVLAQARRQAEEMVTRATQEADKIRSNARQAAQAEHQRIVSRAEQEAEAARQQAMQELRAEVADLAVLAAGRVIRRSLDSETHRALVEEFLAEANGRANSGS
jgi:F-type H+-transporting ATPase subunit b